MRVGMKAVEDGSWGNWNPTWLLGPGLEGAVVGVVGLGRIGSAVVERIRPFGVARVFYTDIREIPHAVELRAEFKLFDDLLSSSDYVICCCALTAETRGMFNKSVFRKMKSSGIFINTSRGGVVNQDDLYTALSTNQIAGAGLDVTTPEPLPINSPLLTLNNCIVTPHIASATRKTRSLMADLTSQNIITCLNGEEMPAHIR